MIYFKYGFWVKDPTDKVKRRVTKSDSISQRDTATEI